MPRKPLPKADKKSHILNLRLNPAQLALVDECTALIRNATGLEVSRSQTVISLALMGEPEFRKRYAKIEKAS